MKKQMANSTPYLASVSIFVSLILGLYYSTFTYLFGQWQNDNSNYCLLVPFIVVYLIWEKREELLSVSSKPSWYGVVILLFGIVLFWLGELGGEYYSLYTSFWLVTMGFCLALMGNQKIRTILFPLLFIITMFPFPSFVNNRITLALKLISTKIGVLMMRSYGMSAFQDGNVIDLGFTKLQVVDACSGLRYLFPLIVLGILMAYFFKSRWWKKLLIVLSTIPITILTNSLRIALTGILSERFGSKAVEGFFHDFEGWLIFMIAFACLGIEMLVLSKLFPESTATAQSNKSANLLKGSIDNPPVIQPPLLKQPQFIISVVILTLTLVLSQGIEFREAIPITRKFDTFPMKVGNWQGKFDVMEDQFINVLDFSDYIMVDYSDDKGAVINFYVAYYESQRKGESIHSPETCLRGGGWQFSQSGDVVLPLEGQKKMTVSRALIEKGPYRQISYYWFPMRGRILTNAFQMKWYNFWDALTQQRTDGALVRVIAPVEPDESSEDAEKRLKSFVRLIVPVLSEYLPGK